MKLTSPKSPLYFLVHPSTREPGRVQLTQFDGDGKPIGHTTWDQAMDAIASAIGLRACGQIPVGDRSYKPEEP